MVIAGGGTGGHLYPGIAVARELLARRPDAQVSFAGTARGIETRVVPREGFPLDLIRSAGLKGKSLADRARGAPEAAVLAPGEDLDADQADFHWPPPLPAAIASSEYCSGAQG